MLNFSMGRIVRLCGYYWLLAFVAFAFTKNSSASESPPATVPPSIVDNFTAECRAGFAFVKINKTFEQQYDSTKHAQYYEACASDPDLQEVHFNYMKANYELTGCTFSKAGVVLNGFNSQIKVHRECWSAATTITWSHGIGFTKLSDSSGAGCPPSDNPTYTDPLDYDGDGEVDACSDPAQACRQLDGTETGDIFTTHSNVGDFSQWIDKGNGCFFKISDALCAGDTCVLHGKYTGQKSSVDFDPAQEASDDPANKPDLNTKTESEPCVLTADASGNASCVGKEVFSEPDEYKCGEVNGVFTCTHAEGGTTTIDTEKEQTTVTDAEGNSTETTVTDVTTTICRGENCSSTSTTTTDTETRNGSGEKTGGSSTCVGDSCGTAPSDGKPKVNGVQDWYTPDSEKTVASEFEKFKARMSEAPFLDSVENFLTVNVSGSCPVYSTSIDVFGTITLDQWCSDVMNSIWPLVYAVVVASAAYLSFRIAFQ